DAVNGVMIGPYDISGSMGIPGQLEHPRVAEACGRVIEACRRHRKACGTQVIEPTEHAVAAALEIGYTFVVLASDVFILWKWSERMRKLMETLHKRPRPPFDRLTSCRARPSVRGRVPRRGGEGVPSKVEGGAGSFIQKPRASLA
ncbi:MAG: hypothetical protein HYZ89_08420, partial [Candidatus Omnitrophica bacterium]|nr:hypothetical protein [Candidatus Omnitrophota bacterium]